MNIYILKNGEKENELIPFLSEERREKLGGINSVKVKREKIYAYALLRYCLFEEQLISSAPSFSYGEKGKPFLSGYPDIHFSISHSGGYSGCVVSNEEIGLDIQDFRPCNLKVTSKICTDKELDFVLGGDVSPSFETCRLWCMKEARGKLTGKGFFEGFDKTETSELIERGELFNTVTEDDLFISVCGYSALPEIKIVSVSEEKLFEMLNAMS
ncbi:MAG: 4'-phosphopantetheinyl transferase superfamily protein [Ruminiclostridium sp.]|nr:4'-phosphopantetheinyl transferase superfamily protein [Ruminiclostridium sp.]